MLRRRNIKLYVYINLYFHTWLCCFVHTENKCLADMVAKM